MNGQLSIFDAKEKTRPCDYRFKRYIGQMVKFHDGKVGRITEIHMYYTYIKIKSGKILVGTPHDIIPVQEADNESGQR